MSIIRQRTVSGLEVVAAAHDVVVQHTQPFILSRSLMLVVRADLRICGLFAPVGVHFFRA